jgi:hypothetical protein
MKTVIFIFIFIVITLAGMRIHLKSLKKYHPNAELLTDCLVLISYTNERNNQEWPDADIKGPVHMCSQ